MRNCYYTRFVCSIYLRIGRCMKRFVKEKKTHQQIQNHTAPTHKNSPRHTHTYTERERERRKKFCVWVGVFGSFCVWGCVILDLSWWLFLLFFTNLFMDLPILKYIFILSLDLQQPSLFIYIYIYYIYVCVYIYIYIYIYIILSINESFCVFIC